MNKKIWDIYAPIYEKVMCGDRKAYGLMYGRIPKRSRNVHAFSKAILHDG